MSDSRAIKNRIKSIKSTAKITKALQLVSVAKMQKAQDKSRRNEIYANTLEGIVSKLGNLKDSKIDLVMDHKEIKNIAIVVIGTDRGFVGNMISNMVNEIKKLKSEISKTYPNAKLSGVSIHKTGMKVILNSGINSIAHFENYNENKKQYQLSPIFSYLTTGFIKEEFDLVYLVSTRFRTISTQEVESKQLLPFKFENKRAAATSDLKISMDYTFEPDAEKIIKWIIPEYFQSQIYSAILSSIASEHSSRMVAMKKATDNANELTKDLTLIYNKKRQADITNAIIEVISGSIN